MLDLIDRWIARRQKEAPPHLAEAPQRAASVPFAPDLLEVDEPLWGGFWNGDVIAPGYRLPAVELALLRAIRLDGTWPENATVADFLADLRQAINHPHSGIWAVRVAGQSCLVFAAQIGAQPVSGSISPVTVAWYCANTDRLHAGYRTSSTPRSLAGAVQLRPMALNQGSRKPDSDKQGWLVQSAIQAGEDRPSPLAARLDAEILKIRAGALPPEHRDALVA